MHDPLERLLEAHDLCGSPQRKFLRPDLSEQEVDERFSKVGLRPPALRDAEQLAIRDCGKTIDNLTNKINARKQAIKDDLEALYSTLGGFLP